MDKIHVIVKVLSAIFFLWFLIPVVTSKILNIGNATGLGVFALIFCCDLFHKPLFAVVKKIWGYAIGKVGLLIIAFAICAIFLTAMFETVCLISAACKKPQKEATIVCLGCAVYGERPSLTLKRRIDLTGDLLEQNPDAVAILSGGKGDGENIAEAECMYRELVKRGIDPSRLYKEDTSTSTRTNLSNSLLIIEENGLSRDLALVTSEYHEYRAQCIAKKLGLSYGAIPSHSPWWLLPTYYVRELYGILYEWFL